MQYQFNGGAVGECRVEMRTAGKHGFASPKIFRITCMGNASAQGVTFRFTDKLVAGMKPDEFTNATLCRLAIAQYLRLSPQSTAQEHAAASLALDTASPPFEGPVLNARGVVLTVSRLHSPRGMARAAQAQFPAATLTDIAGYQRPLNTSAG